MTGVQTCALPIFSQPGGDLRELTKALNARLQGRGGGKPAFVQGSVQTGEEAIRAFFQ